jgi:hypothetical protein
MNKKIESLKTAYRKGDKAALVKAARSLLAYNAKHPMAMICNPGSQPIVELAAKIAAAA